MSLSICSPCLRASVVNHPPGRPNRAPRLYRPCLIRRLFRVAAFFAFCLAAVPTCPVEASEDQPQRPNVVVIIADDAGYGDVGHHGNPVLRTPHLDRLAAESAELTNFYVCPVCAPTRAGLLTGRYNYRTGVVDTFIGRAMMHADEVTLAEVLAAAGYRTGIFGKWHLGDNYPLRPGDQGFHESLVHKGGGIGQASDLPGGTSYFDAVLLENGRARQTHGYCSDVYTDAAIGFVERNAARPFFVYLAFNAPHDPLEVPDDYLAMYPPEGLRPESFPNVGQPLPAQLDVEKTARVYGMVTNIDDNVGRVLARLGELQLARDTIVVYLTDNGPAFPRYNGGLRGQKGSVYEGGIRVPCFVRWPAEIPAGTRVEQPAAHIDLAPTLWNACDVGPPAGIALDGRSLLPLLRGEAVEWPDRTLYLQWHRGDEPELYRAFAARGPRWKLLQSLGVAPGPLAETPRFELYDLAADPFETTDLAAEQPDIVARMQAEYAAWFADVSATRGYAPPRIVLGTAHENPTLLTRQDWRGPQAGWGPKSVGHWEVEWSEAGAYEVTLNFPAGGTGIARLRLGDDDFEQPFSAGATEAILGPMTLTAGPGRLAPLLEIDGETLGVESLEVRRIDR